MVRTRAAASKPTGEKLKRARREFEGRTAPKALRGTVVVDLGRDLEEAIFVRRPSRRNRSPYVCDVRLVAGGTECIAHVPNLDSGGKMRAGVRVLCGRQKGVTASSLGPHGTPKCELIARLLRCEDRENANAPDGGVWVSAHPALAEQIALGLLKQGALDDRLHPSPIVKGEGIRTQKMLRRQSTESVSQHYVEECLECCRANGLRGAQAFLLDKMGDLDAAFHMYLEDVGKINGEMVACSRPEAQGQLTSRAETACDAAVSLCARLRSPDVPFQGPLDHPEQPALKYKQLVVAYVRSYAENRESMPAWAKAVLTSQIKLVAQRAGNLESIVRHVIDTFQDVPTRDMKDVLALLLSVGEFEATKVKLAAAIAQRDVSAALQTAYRECSMGR